MVLFLIRSHIKDYIFSIEESSKSEKEVENEEVDSEEDKDWKNKDISFYQYFLFLSYIFSLLQLKLILN